MGDGDRWSVTNNTMFGSIVATNPEIALIAGNNAYQVATVTRAWVEINTSGTDILIVGNNIPNIGWEAVYLDGVSHARVEGNTFGFTTDQAIYLDGCTDVAVADNTINEAGGHGIRLTDSTDCLVDGNKIYWPGVDTNNTYDGVLLDGNSDDNDIWDNKITAATSTPQPRYGINISASTCNTNSYLGNRVSGTYATAAYRDAGTGTINVWPGAAAPQGDNLL